MEGLTLRHCQVPPDHYDREIKNNLFLRIWHKRRFAEVGKTLGVPVVGGAGPRSILDIGCHGGTFTEAISKKFPQARVSGIDISKVAIDYAKKTRPKIHFEVASADNLPFPNQTFDLITCFDTFEHLPNSAKVLSEIKRVLTKEGKVIFSIPTENFLFRTVWFFWSRFGPGKVWQGTHVQNFNGMKLDKLLEKSGFKIEERKTINFKMLLLIKVRKH